MNPTKKKQGVKTFFLIYNLCTKFQSAWSNNIFISKTDLVPLNCFLNKIISKFNFIILVGIAVYIYFSLWFHIYISYRRCDAQIYAYIIISPLVKLLSFVLISLSLFM